MRKIFKIGEYAVGGIIAAEIFSEDVRIQARDWDTGEVIFEEVSDDLHYLESTLLDWTSYYYAEQVMDWIKENANVAKEVW